MLESEKSSIPESKKTTDGKYKCPATTKNMTHEKITRQFAWRSIQAECRVNTVKQIQK